MRPSSPWEHRAITPSRWWRFKQWVRMYGAVVFAFTLLGIAIVLYYHWVVDVKIECAVQGKSVVNTDYGPQCGDVIGVGR